MKKMSFSEKMAKKSFESANVQKNWQIHLQIFGPILEPAFIDNFQARIHLTSALNYISNRKLKEGLKKLELIENICVTDADKAALLFFMGLCFEMANMKEQMLSYYQNAGEYGHRFYLPYLKVAKSANNDGVYDIAEKNYLLAIDCFTDDHLDDQKRTILGSIYANYASCLTMMHNYEGAKTALQKSYEISPEQKGRTAIEAIIEAVKGNSEKAMLLVNHIAIHEPSLYKNTYMAVNDIIDMKHPHFHIIKLPDRAVNTFWEWFVANEAILLNKLDQEEHDFVFQMLQLKLKEVFPFMERDLALAIELKDNKYEIIFADFYVTSLEHGYKELINAAPNSLSLHWMFNIVH